MTNTLLANPLIRNLHQKFYNPAIRTAIILGVLLVAAAVAFISSETISLLLIGFLVGIGMVLIFLRHPALGILAIIPASFVIPIEIGVSSGSSLNAPMLLLILMTGLWLLDMLVIKRQIRLSLSKTFLPLASLLIIVLLAFLNGQLPWFAFASRAPITAQIGGLAIITLSICAFILTAHLIKEVLWLKWMTWIFLGFGGVFLIAQTLPWVQYDPGRGHLYKFFNYGSIASLFWCWMVALSIGQALYNRLLAPWQRVALFFLGLLTLYYSYTLIPGWKSGWVPALVTIIILFVLRSKKIAIIFAIAAVAAAPIFIGNLITTDQYSYDTRIEAWLLIAKIIKVSPFLGLGPANYYWYTPLFPIRGYAVQFNSHNQFVDLVAQIGLLGLIAFLWLTIQITNLGWKLRVKAPDGFAKAYVYCTLAGLAGTMVSAMLGDWVLPFVYNVGFLGFKSSVFAWLFLGGLIALNNITEDKEK